MSTEYEYFNAHRLYQATFLRSRMADDGLGLIHHRVLGVLARKMADASAPRSIIELDTCFPSLDTIAQESMLSDKSVRNAIRKLVEKKYLTISKIKGHRLRKASDKMTWDANRYHLVPETWDTISSPFRKSDKTVSLLTAAQPVSIPPTQAEAAVLDTLETKPTKKDYKPKKKVEVPDELMAMLFDNFGDHPSLALPTAKNIAADCISKCIAAADGDVAACALVFNDFFPKPEIKAEAYRTDKLGGYVRNHFPDWLVQFDRENLTFMRGGGIEFLPACTDKDVQPFINRARLNKTDDERLDVTLGNDGSRIIRLLSALLADPAPEADVRGKVEDVISDDEIAARAEEFWLRERA